MIRRSQEIIDSQEADAQQKKQKGPTHTVYPELLDQIENYHLLYQEKYLFRLFAQTHGRQPNNKELETIVAEAKHRSTQLIMMAKKEASEVKFFQKAMETPRLPDQVNTAEEFANRLMTITSPAYKEKMYRAIVGADTTMKQAYVDIYNAFNSRRFDEFMVDLATKSLQRCRAAGQCGPNQREGIPDKYLAQILKEEADKLGVALETISLYVGREPGRLYFQRIRRGSLLIDEGAPGNHGMMPHGLQNLFIYQLLGKSAAQRFFSHLTGWVYERMFDINDAFTPIPSTRDITRRQYWTGVFKAGDRSEISKLGTISGEEGRYPSFLRLNQLELVSVEEIETNLLNNGSLIRARYKGREFTFLIDRDGVPESAAEKIVQNIKSEFERSPVNHLIMNN
jgi:hypothetical protein